MRSLRGTLLYNHNLSFLFSLLQIEGHGLTLRLKKLPSPEEGEGTAISRPKDEADKDEVVGGDGQSQVTVK